MAKAGNEIVNPRTGQRMLFLETGRETNGERVCIESYNPPSSALEGEHVHPFQESGAEVLSGSLRFSVGGEERSVGAGESITIPANTPHFFWNDGEEEAHFVGWFRPALKIDEFFEAVFGLAQDNKLTEKGLPSLLQIAVMMPRFGDEIRLASPPWPVQKVLFGALAPVGRLLGYRAEYPYPYHDGPEGPEGYSAREGGPTSAISGASGVAVATSALAVLFWLFLIRRRQSGKR